MLVAKNSLEQKVFFTPPSLITLEGIVVSRDKGGVNFKYRKPGSQTYFTEYFPFNSKFYGVVGDDGKDGGRLYLLGHHEVYGGKVRNELIAHEVSFFAEGFVKADTEAGTAIFAASHTAFKAEDTSANRKGRKVSEKAEKPTKKKKKKVEASEDMWED